MNPLMNRAIMLVLAMALIGGTAIGEDRLTANIPFAFQTTADRLPSGNYNIVAGFSGKGHVLQLRNLDTNKSYVVLFTAPVLGTLHGDSSAHLEFQCENGNCWLSEVWPGFGRDGWALSLPRSAQAKHLATVKVKLIPRS